MTVCFSIAGARSADALISAALNAANSLVRSRMSGGGSGSSSSGGTGGKKSVCYSIACNMVSSSHFILQGGSSDDVVKLTDANFEELVVKSNDMWLVEFFAPWYVSYYTNSLFHKLSFATQLIAVY